MQAVTDGEILGKTGDYELLEEVSIHGVPVKIYLNKKKNRTEVWHVNNDGKYFLGINPFFYVGIIETEEGWKVDGSKRLERISENVWAERTFAELKPSHE